MKKTIKGYTFDWYSSRELATMFLPDSREIIKRNIGIVEKDIAEQKKIFLKASNLVKKSKTDNFTKDFCRQIIRMEIILTVLKRKKFLMSLKNDLASIQPRQSNKYIRDFQEELTFAKNYPINEVASRFMDLKQNGDKYCGICPFHNEKHASFFTYTRSNTYHCFGCGAHGDVINLTMELYSTDFKGAVKILQKQ
jgi:hypothetical protein